MANKTCTKCQETKTLDQFYKTNTYNWEKDGHDYYCKYCRVGSHLNSINNQAKKCSLKSCERPHYAKNLCRLHYARKQRTGTTGTKTKTITTATKTYKNKNVFNKHNYLMSTYKISLDEFLKKAANGCEICGDVPERSLHVDHDHNCCDSPKSCGACVRGVICGKCNMAVDKMENGLMRPDYPRYKAIQQYLEAYNG